MGLGLNPDKRFIKRMDLFELILLLLPAAARSSRSVRAKLSIMEDILEHQVRRKLRENVANLYCYRLPSLAYEVSRQIGPWNLSEGCYDLTGTIKSSI